MESVWQASAENPINQFQSNPNVNSIETISTIITEKYGSMIDFKLYLTRLNSSLNSLANRNLQNTIEVYEKFLENKLTIEQNESNDLINLDYLTKKLDFLTTTDIPIEQAMNFSKNNLETLVLLLDNFKDISINDYSPIYHDPEKELSIHPVEFEMNKLTELKQVDIISLANLLESFSSVFKNNPDNQDAQAQALSLKKANLEKFFTFVSINLLRTKLNYDQAEYLKKIKYELHFIENELNSILVLSGENNQHDSTMLKSLERLNTMIEFKENQNSILHDCMKNLAQGFGNLKLNLDNKIKSLNFIRKHMRLDVLNLMKKPFHYEHLDQLLSSKYIDSTLKNNVRELLVELLNTKDLSKNKDMNKKELTDELKKFCQIKRELITSTLNDLSFKQETVMNLLLVFLKYSFETNMSNLEFSPNLIKDLSKHFDKYEIYIQLDHLNSNLTQHLPFYLKIDKLNEKHEIVFLDKHQSNIAISLTPELLRNFVNNGLVYLAEDDELYKILKNEHGFKLDCGLEKLIRHLTDLCDKFKFERIKQTNLNKAKSKPKIPKKTEHANKLQDFLAKLYLNEKSIDVLKKCEIFLKSTTGLSRVQESSVLNGKAVFVIKKSNQQFDIIFRELHINNCFKFRVLVLNANKEANAKSIQIINLLNKNFKGINGEAVCCQDEQLKNMILNEVVENKAILSNDAIKAYQTEAELVYERLRMLENECIELDKLSDSKPERLSLVKFMQEELEFQIENELNKNIKNGCGVDLNKFMRKLNNFLDNIAFLILVKRLLRNSGVDIEGYKDMIYQYVKLEPNIIYYLMELVKFYGREQNESEALVQHLERNSGLIDAKLKSLLNFGKNEQDANEFKKQVIINGIILDRLVDLNNQFYRKLAELKCETSLFSELEQSIFSIENKSIDFSFYHFYNAKSEFKEKIASLFDEVDRLMDESYFKVNFKKRIEIYKYLADDLFSKSSLEFSKNVPVKNELDGCLNLNQYLNRLIELFKDKCLLKLSGLVDFNEQKHLKKVNEEIGKLNESRIAKHTLKFTQNEIKDLDSRILIKKQDNDQIDSIRICFLNEKNKHLHELSLDINDFTDEEKIIILESASEVDYEFNPKFQFIYDLVVHSQGLIYYKADFSKSFSSIFILFLEKLNYLNEKDLEIYLDAFKIWLESFRQVDYEIIKALKEKLSVILSTSKQNESIINSLKEIDEILNEKTQLQVELVSSECKRLLYQSVNIEHKNRILNLVAKHKPQLQLCQHDELKKSAAKIESFLMSIYELNTNASLISGLDWYGLLVEYQIFKTSLEMESSLNCARSLREQEERLNLYTRIFNLKKVNESSDVNDIELKKTIEEQNKKLIEYKKFDKEGLLKLLDVLLKKNLSEKDEKSFSESASYINFLTNKLIQNFKFTLEENKQAPNEISDTLVEIESRLQKINNKKFCTTILNGFYKIIKETLSDQIAQNYNRLKSLFEQNEKFLEQKHNEILDIFWNNIKFSDIFNKEREKTFINICLVKLNELERQKILMSSENAESLYASLIKSLDEVKVKFEEYQLNPDKKVFTKNILNYLNLKINEYIPDLIENEDNHTQISELQRVNFKDETYLNTIKSLNNLIESQANYIKENNDSNGIKTETKAFLKQFCDVYEYFSFRSIELKKEDKDNLNEAFNNLRISSRKIHFTFETSNLDELNRLNKIIYLRTNESLLQEELTYFKNKSLSRFKLIMELLKLNKDKIQEFNIDETGADNQMISAILKENIKEITLNKSEKELERLQINFLEKYEIQNYEKEDYSLCYEYDFDDMNFILESRFKSIQDKTTSAKQAVYLHQAIHFNELKEKILNEKTNKMRLKKEKLTLIPCKSISKWIGILVELDLAGEVVRLDIIDPFSSESSQSDTEHQILKSTFPQFENKIKYYTEYTEDYFCTAKLLGTGPLTIENLLLATGFSDLDYDKIEKICEIRKIHYDCLKSLSKSSLSYLNDLIYKQKQQQIEKKVSKKRKTDIKANDKIETNLNEPDLTNMEKVSIETLLSEARKMMDIDLDGKVVKEAKSPNEIVERIRKLEEYLFEKISLISDHSDREKFGVEIENLKKILIDEFLTIFMKELNSQNSQSKDHDQDSFLSDLNMQKESIRKVLIENHINDWQYELDQMKMSSFSKNLLKTAGFTIDLFKNNLKEMTSALILYSEFKTNVWDVELENVSVENELIECFDDVNSNLNSVRDSFDELSKLVMQFLLSKLDLTSYALFKKYSQKFLYDLIRLNRFKVALQSALFFMGTNNFLAVVNIFNKKLNAANKEKLHLTKEIEKLTDLFYAMPNLRSDSQVIEILNVFHPEKWLFYFSLQKLELHFFDYFEKYLNNLEFKDLPDDRNVNKETLDALIEAKLTENVNKLGEYRELIWKHIERIEKNESFNQEDCEEILKFLSSKLSFELNKQPIAMISPNNLEKFIKLLVNVNVSKKLIDALKKVDKKDDDEDEEAILDSQPDELQSKENSSNQRLFVRAVGFKSFLIIKPFLEKFWIADELQIESFLLLEDQTSVLNQLDIIKNIYSEQLMFSLVDAIKHFLQKENKISQTILMALKKFSDQNWMLNDEIIDLIKSLKSSYEWQKAVEAYTNEQRCKKRDLRELFNIMKKGAIESGSNSSIKSMLDENELLIKDIERILALTKKPVERFVDFTSKPIEEWSIDDIKKWASLAKGNKLLDDKIRVEEAIAVVCRAIKLFKGFYPRETQLISIWLFMNPDINQGKIAKISTGEGKSIIVASIAAIKALGCERVDILTSSNVLAVRDAVENEPFFDMFELQVSNNCDEACEKGHDSKTSEEVRKLRYFNEKGAVDIVYGEAGCFERDILLTEFNRNDDKLNIIGDRMKGNAVASVIVDEVDSMFLDKATMVLYLSHNIDTLRSLERIFVCIWQLVNQYALETDDDTISVISDLILDQIDKNQIELPQYKSSSSCEYADFKSFIRRRMANWIRNAIHVKYMSPNDTYVLTKDKSKSNNDEDVQITVMDKETGTEQATTRWSNGVHQFLQLKHTRRLTPESLKAVFLSNMTYFKRYKNKIAGVTGSLGTQTEQEILNNIYNVGFFEIPRFKPELFIKMPGKMFSNRPSWIKGILETVDEQIKKRQDNMRAVLIICDSVNDVLNIKEALMNDYPNAKDYKSSYEKFEIDEMRPGDVIIATNLAGRGTDLLTSDLLEANGGLHVIVTSMPSNVRIEVQAFGRTARKGNRGSGQFVVYNSQGLSIDKLVETRNRREKERLNAIETVEMHRIIIEEKLLNGFSADDEGLSCVGFAQIYEQVRQELSESSGNDRAYLDAQLYSLKNRWAFWLDSVTDLIRMVTVGNTKKTIIENFHKFKSDVENDMKNNGWNRLITEPAEFIKLAKHYRDSENWTRALHCYSEAAKDPFYSYANYYVSACRLNVEYKEGLSVKKEFKSSLVGAKRAIEKELQFLMMASQISQQVSEQNRKQGFAGHGNEYEKDIKEKSAIWNIFLTSVSGAIGSDINPKSLIGNKYLNEENAKKLIDKLIDSSGIKPERISKSFKIDENLELIKIDKHSRDKNKEKKIQLPELFNNQLTKQKLYEYLKEKKKERESNPNESKSGKMDLSNFKDDLSKRDVFVPYLEVFINEALEKGFLQNSTNNKGMVNEIDSELRNETISEINIYTFDGETVTDEKLKDKKFPVLNSKDDFLNENKQIVTDALKKIKVIRKEKNEILKQLKEGLTNLVENAKSNNSNKQSLKERFSNFFSWTSNNQSSLKLEDSLFDFLLENSFIRKEEKYLVSIERIFHLDSKFNYAKRKNPDIKDENKAEIVNKQEQQIMVKFMDHRDMEKCYTAEFLKWHESFRKLFIRTLITQIDESGEQEESELQYLTLNNEVYLSDFQIVPNKNAAVECLWGFLKSNDLIKPTKANVGLISSKIVKKKCEKIKKSVEDFLKANHLADADQERNKELEMATNTVFNIIDQTIGELKKIPDDKTIASFLNIEKSYFLDQAKHAPEGLSEFIDLAIEVVFRLEEQKDPPKWYEIVAVIALGVGQVVGGILFKTFVPCVGSIIGDFLISTGTDDICFGIQSALTGEFSWNAYWEQKKQSMITAAITSMSFFAFSMLKTSLKLKSVSKAWNNFHKISKAERLRQVGGNVTKFVGKEIVKNLGTAAVSSFISYGIDKALEPDESSSMAKKEVNKSFEDALNENWSTIETQMDNLYEQLNGDQRAEDIIADCINRRLQNIYEVKWFRTINKYAGPAIQGFFNAMVVGNKGSFSKRLNFVPSLANIGISTYELSQMISEFSASLMNDLKDALNRELANRNQSSSLHVKSSGLSAKNEFKDFKKEKKRLIIQQLQDSYNKKLNSSIISPLLNTGANQAVNFMFEKLISTTKAEAASENIGIMDAIYSTDDAPSEERYKDDLAIYRANDAREIDMNTLKVPHSEIYPVNLQLDDNGEKINLEQAKAKYGDKIRVFVDKDGNFFVRRTSTKEQLKAIATNKPAGKFEQKVAPSILGVDVKKVENPSNGDEERQELTRKDSPDQKKVTLVTKKNDKGIVHMQVEVDGQMVDLPPNIGKNDCYYASLILANEIAKGKSVEEVKEMLKDGKEILKLRNSVANTLRLDKKVIHQMRTGANVDARAHYNNLIGQDSTKIKVRVFQLNDSNKIIKKSEKTIEMTHDEIYKKIYKPLNDIVSKCASSPASSTSSSPLPTESPNGKMENQLHLVGAAAIALYDPQSQNRPIKDFDFSIATSDKTLLSKVKDEISKNHQHIKLGLDTISDRNTLCFINIPVLTENKATFYVETSIHWIDSSLKEANYTLNEVRGIKMKAPVYLLIDKCLLKRSEKNSETFKERTANDLKDIKSIIKYIAKEQLNVERSKIKELLNTIGLHDKENKNLNKIDSYLKNNSNSNVL